MITYTIIEIDYKSIMLMMIHHSKTVQP